ncbi:MAG: Coenzyme F420 hydrogenase/dehydrogenase, beta subunit C-terminal domain [Cyanobacteriota bacterium]|nr:Coenzyme F420 hydrogenase/dehydrogenase, beta subunit C-terminal domain [Cyanobacteriota bacterium]
MASGRLSKSPRQAQPIRSGHYPAKELCSECGLCDTQYVQYVKSACAFINPQIEALEQQTHGQSRAIEDATNSATRQSPTDTDYFGVHQAMLTARKRDPIAGAQWTGIVSTIAIAALEQGWVEGVICVQADETDRFQPRPVLARTAAEILAAKVNKPTLSPNLSVLETVKQSGCRRLLVIGVGCQIQALRAVESQLGLEKLYVLGTPCVDNVSRAGLQKFLEVTSHSPATVVSYEFMQDFRVHFKHEDGSVEKVPFFGLKTPQLKDVFAPSCLSCFDYVNGLADLVVGYMGSPFGWQWLVVRNERGQALLDLVKDQLDWQPVISKGQRQAAVQQSISLYDRAASLPMWLARLMASVIDKIGPQGLEYARFSIDSHFTRNYLYVRRHYPQKLARQVPGFAQRIVAQYQLPND